MTQLIGKSCIISVNFLLLLSPIIRFQSMTTDTTANSRQALDMLLEGRVEDAVALSGEELAVADTAGVKPTIQEMTSSRPLTTFFRPPSPT